MKKIILSAGFLIFASHLPAQHFSQILETFLYQWKFERSFDENLFNPLSETEIPQKLIKSIPVTQNRDLKYFAEPIGRKTAYLFAAENGSLVFTTEYRRNQLRGIWVGRYTDGHKLDSGHFNNNIPDGEWRTWYPNGQLRSIRTYDATKYFAVNNEVRRRNEKIMYHSLSKIGLTQPANFEYITSAKYSYNNFSSTAEQDYVAPFINCLHHGLYMNFYANGAVKDSGYYREGLRDGVWDEFYDNGQLKSSGYYYKGQKNSGWKYYSNKGKLIMLSEYRDGKLIHRKKYL